MADRPTREPKKKLATEVTNALISGGKINKSNKKEKYSKLIIWDIRMKEILEKEAMERDMSVMTFVKYCVAKEINK